MSQTTIRQAGAKLRILEAAEALFAGNDINSVSIRHITRAAPANVAAVNYHFGNRDGLVTAVIGRCLEGVDEERMDRLMALGEANAASPVESILRAFAEPLVDHVFRSEHSRNLFRNLAPRIAAGEEMATQGIYLPRVSGVVGAFSRALAWHFPALPQDSLELRLHAASRKLVAMVADETKAKSADEEALVARFVREAIASLRADARFNTAEQRLSGTGLSIAEAS